MQAADAIADPVRRAILELLAMGDRSAGAIAAEFEISRPAVSRHLRVLREQGVVAARSQGRLQVYTLRAEPLLELAAWLSTLVGTAEQWSRRFAALETEVHRARRDRLAGTLTAPPTADHTDKTRETA